MYEIENGHIKGIIKDITLNITFPFAKEHDKHMIFIYQETLKDIESAQEESLCLSLESESSDMYIGDVDKLLCSLSEEVSLNLDYPSIELFYKNTKLIFPDICIFTLLKNMNIILKCNRPLLKHKISNHHYLSTA